MSNLITFRLALVLMVLFASVTQAGCAYLAAGAAGAAVGHEIADEDDEDEE